ncbi:MAG: hypothetical protein P4N59_19065 [Negativicutes bacterium]|nr:hypothetical protein [Negativicutes bacterium]
MLSGMFDTVAAVLAVFLCCIAVKLTDDYLDKDMDRRAGRSNWATRLGPCSMVYAMIILCLAVTLNPQISASLFIACYIIGMFNDLGTLLPSGMRGWQESLLVLLLGFLFIGWHLLLFSLLFIAAVQLFDDYIDMRTDRLCGQRNMACRFGSVECLTLCLLFLSVAFILDEELFNPVVMGTVIFYSIQWFGERRRSL